MNKYIEMHRRHQAEVNALPLGAAFNNKQFEEMMLGWGLDPEKDLDKICRISGGMFIQKKDKEHMEEVLHSHDTEMKEAIEADKDGTGFIYEMFLFELDNHEYGYTGDPEDACNALGYTVEEVVNDKRLSAAFMKAHKEIMRRSW